MIQLTSGKSIKLFLAVDVLMFDVEEMFGHTFPECFMMIVTTFWNISLRQTTRSECVIINFRDYLSMFLDNDLTLTTAATNRESYFAFA